MVWHCLQAEEARFRAQLKELEQQLCGRPLPPPTA
jgi:hypothetical protein